MNPSDTAIAWIKSYVASLSDSWAGNTDRDVVTAANTPSIANPAPQGTVPKPYTAASLLGLFSQASAASVEGFPALQGLFDAISAQDGASIAAAVALLEASGRVQPSEAAAITAAVTATEPDPSYPALIGAAQSHIGRTLDIDDVATARAAAGQSPNP
jgi:hypothetical protein